MPEPTAQWNPARSVWETQETLICGHSDVFSETWPRSGMTRRGRLYALPTSAPRTAGSGSSSSPGRPLLNTPTSSEAAGGSQEWADRWPSGEVIPEVQQRLRTQVLILQPPGSPKVRATETVVVAVARGELQGEPSREGSGGDDLTTAVHRSLLPTPAARDWKGGVMPTSQGQLTTARGEGGTSDLASAAMWVSRETPLLPTPAVNDMGAGKTPEDWDAWTAKMKAAHGNGNGHGASLSIEALRLLPTPTPTAADSAGARNATACRGPAAKAVQAGTTLTDWAWQHEGYTDPKLPGDRTSPPSDGGNACSDE